MHHNTDLSVIAPPCGMQHQQTPNRFSQAMSIFRRLLSLPLAAAMRLHQYRNLHSATVYAALCQLDGCDQS